MNISASRSRHGLARWLVRTLAFAFATLFIVSCGGEDVSIAPPANPPLAWDAGSWDQVTWQ